MYLDTYLDTYIFHLGFYIETFAAILAGKRILKISFLLSSFT